jgi:hypothetical protein
VHARLFIRLPGSALIGHPAAALADPRASEASCGRSQRQRVLDKEWVPFSHTLATGSLLGRHLPLHGCDRCLKVLCFAATCSENGGVLIAIRSCESFYLSYALSNHRKCNAAFSEGYR